MSYTAVAADNARYYSGVVGFHWRADVIRLVGEQAILSRRLEQSHGYFGD
jgi:hypothetical protein